MTYRVSQIWGQDRRASSKRFNIQKVERAEVTEAYIDDLRRRGAKEIADRLEHDRQKASA